MEKKVMKIHDTFGTIGYKFQGNRYESYTDLLAAVQAANSEKRNSLLLSEPSGLDSFLSGGSAQLLSKIQTLFRQYAGSDQKLQWREMMMLAMSLAAELGVDASAFGDLDAMFYRFDFSGDGALDEVEGKQLVMHMLRVYRDSTAAPDSQRKFDVRSIPTKRRTDDYVIVRKLGQGGQGAVYLAHDKQKREQKVIKFYDKTDANAPVESIVEEFNLLTKLDHPRIARIYEIFQDRKNIYTVSDYLFGGHVGELVGNAHNAGVRITEDWLANIFKQTCEGVAYLHSRKIMHCDLKEANVMISGEDEWASPNVVVIDFGLAQNFSGSRSGGGTPGYMPPEVIEQHFWCPKGDTFSLAVMFYQMFCGCSPFGGRSVQEIVASTLACQPDMAVLDCSPLFKQMIGSMMLRDFIRRPMVQQVLKAPWWKYCLGDGNVELPKGHLEQFARQRKRTALKSALIAEINRTTDLAQMRELNQLFLSLDKDGDGFVTAQEAKSALRGKMVESELDGMLKLLMGSDGRIGYTQFVGEMMAAKFCETDELLWMLFEEVDTDSSGTLSMKEVKKMLQMPAVRQALGGHMTAEQFMKEADLDSSGQVEFREFKRVLEGQPAGHKPAFRKGEPVQYFSTTYNQWIDTNVSEVHPSGAIQIAAKLGFWFRTPAEQQQKLRQPPAAGSAPPAAGLTKLGAQVGLS